MPFANFSNQEIKIYLFNNMILFWKREFVNCASTEAYPMLEDEVTITAV